MIGRGEGSQTGTDVLPGWFSVGRMNWTGDGNTASPRVELCIGVLDSVTFSGEILIGGLIVT